MTDDRTEKHFGHSKKPHTEIKHNLFSNVLKISLSIANQLAIVFNKNNPDIQKTYTYIDLFAGRGKFSDGENGSPLIAFDMLYNHLKNKNYFSKIQFICTDKNKDNVEHLKQEIQKIKGKNQIAKEIECYIECGNWIDFKPSIYEKLKNSGWGFIFADPFSTELDIDALIQMLNECSRFKDILVFFNYNTLTRQHGRACDEDIERICKVLGLNKYDLFDNDKNDFSDKFKYIARQKFLNIKDFVKGVSFPITVSGNLIKADYFYLILATNTIKITDILMCEYETILKKYTSYTPLYEEIDPIEIITNMDSNQISLYELYDKCTDKFLSWKNAVTYNEKIPTIENIIVALNDLIRQKKINIICDRKYLYIRDYQNCQKGEIKYKSIKSTNDTKNIILTYTGNR